MQIKQGDPHSSRLGATAPLKMSPIKQEEAHSTHQSGLPMDSSQADVTDHVGASHLYNMKPREAAQHQTEENGGACVQHLNTVAF